MVYEQCLLRRILFDQTQITHSIYGMVQEKKKNMRYISVLFFYFLEQSHIWSVLFEFYQIIWNKNSSVPFRASIFIKFNWVKMLNDKTPACLLEHCTKSHIQKCHNNVTSNFVCIAKSKFLLQQQKHSLSALSQNSYTIDTVQFCSHIHLGFPCPHFCIPQKVQIQL